MKSKTIALAITAGILFSTTASASNVLVVTTGASDGGLGYGYGNSRWSLFASEVNSAAVGSGGAVSIASTIDASALTFDSMIVDQRWTGASLPAAEKTNLINFIATGKRVLLVGENNSWAQWNNDILSTVGGSYAGQESYSTETPVLVHPLTAGVSSIYLPDAGLAVGGTPLYSKNFATLWGASQSVLSVLDVNVFENYYGNTTFRSNVASWLVSAPSSVPEPTSYALVLGGLLTVGALIRRRAA